MSPEPYDAFDISVPAAGVVVDEGRGALPFHLIHGESLVARTVGQSYPDRSQIRHVYERSSAGLASGFPVQVTFSFVVRYRVSGGGWIELPSISRVAETSYPVRESQSVIQQ